MAYTPDFEIAHIGVNCADAGYRRCCAEQICGFVSTGCEPGQGKCGCTVYRYPNRVDESPGRGLSMDTSPWPPPIFRGPPLPGKKRLCLDEDSVKRFPDGRILVIYAQEQIGGFAIHLMQK